MHNPAYRIQVNYSVELLKRLLSQVDEATCLVLVGDLSRFRPRDLMAVHREEIQVENSLFQESYGRLYIPLHGPNKYILKNDVLPFVGLRQLIRDVLLERYGRLLFCAPNYYKDGAWLSHWFSPEFLQTLEQEGVVGIQQARPSACINRQTEISNNSAPHTSV